MATYEIFFRESVWKELKKVPKADLKKSFHEFSNLELIFGLWGARGLRAMNYTESVRGIIGLYIRSRTTSLRYG